MARSEKVMTPKFRVSFPNVFKPRENDRGDLRYGVVCLFEPGADISALKQAAAAAGKEAWGDKPPANLRSPFRDQAEKADKYDGYEPGACFISVTAARRPGLVDQSVQPIIDESEFYPGCYARATVNAFTYEVKGNVGVSFGVNNIQKLADGEQIGGGARAAEDFGSVADAVESKVAGARTGDGLPW